LIFRKIIEIVATRCEILKLKCTKFDFGWGSAPDPAGGAYCAPPDPLAGFKGPTSKGRGEERKGRERGGEGERGGRRGEGRRSLLSRPTFQLVPTPLVRWPEIWTFFPDIFPLPDKSPSLFTWCRAFLPSNRLSAINKQRYTLTCTKFIAVSRLESKE